MLRDTDQIEVNEKSKKLNIIDGSIQSKEEIPEYIQLDGKSKSVKLFRVPKFSEVPYPVIMEPNLVLSITQDNFDQRTSIDYINKFLDENPNLNVLDIGCGYTANRRANTIADVQDFSSYYPQKKFVKIREKKLPLKIMNLIL